MKKGFRKTKNHYYTVMNGKATGYGGSLNLISPETIEETVRQIQNIVDCAKAQGYNNDEKWSIIEVNAEATWDKNGRFVEDIITKKAVGFYDNGKVTIYGKKARTMDEKKLHKLLENVEGYCIYRTWNIERVNRPNKSDVFKCDGTFTYENGDIPFTVWIDESNPANFRLTFPTQKDRKRADEYDARDYIRSTIADTLKEA